MQLTTETADLFQHGAGKSTSDAEKDKLHFNLPMNGSRRLRDELKDDGFFVGRDYVRHLMREMGIKAIYPRVRTTHPGKGHKIYP
ncbi:MAG: transposase [Calditrichaeota bacterium]|nr:MAG: transposase [Calditrichota bacterium]